MIRKGSLYNLTTSSIDAEFIFCGYDYISLLPCLLVQISSNSRLCSIHVTLKWFLTTYLRSRRYSAQRQISNLFDSNSFFVAHRFENITTLSHHDDVLQQAGQPDVVFPPQTPKLFSQDLSNAVGFAYI